MPIIKLANSPSISSNPVLSKPVFGLIFLFEYLPEEDETEDEENPSGIWFANQVCTQIYHSVLSSFMLIFFSNARLLTMLAPRLRFSTLS